MANTVTIRKLIDGPRHAYFHVYLKSDGASGELSKQVLVDAATSFYNVPDSLSVVHIWYSNVGFDSLLQFDATTPNTIWKLPAASDSNELCLEEFGGVADPQTTGFNNKIVLSTAGFTAATDEGTIVIKVRKD